MNTTYLNPLFTCSIRIPQQSILCSNRIIHKDFKVLERLLTDFYESFRTVLLEKGSIYESYINTTTCFDYNLLSEDLLQFTIYIKKSENINDIDNLKSAINKILKLSIDLIVIERYHSNRKYIIKDSSVPLLSITEINKSIIIDLSHSMIAKIANRLQEPLTKMYKFNENLYITINIDNEQIKIPGISETIQPIIKRKTDDPDQFMTILHHGNQADDDYNFLITLNTSKPIKLINIDKTSPEELTEIRIKARYRDEVLIEAFTLIKELRGITSPIRDVEFVRLLKPDECTQIQLFPIENHRRD